LTNKLRHIIVKLFQNWAEQSWTTQLNTWQSSSVLAENTLNRLHWRVTWHTIHGKAVVTGLLLHV